MLERLSQDLPLIQYAHLLWGFVLFCALALWVYWPSRRSRMQEHACRILEDETQRGRHVGQ